MNDSRRRIRVFSFALALLAGSGLAAAEGRAQRFFEKPITLGAHRGGAALWPENTVYAFTQAAARWPDVLLESDARLTADGHVVLIHDGTVDRTTDGTGLVERMTLAEIKALDAGYRFTLDGGTTFSHRGQGITVPTLAEALDALPDLRFLIELKPGADLAKAVLDVLRKAHALDRVVLASFMPGLMGRIRQLGPCALTCFDLSSGRRMLDALRGGDWDAYEPTDVMLAIDLGIMNRFGITPEEIRVFHAKGIRVLLHTINRRNEMHELLDMGVDGFLTDKPDVLAEVLEERAAKRQNSP